MADGDKLPPVVDDEESSFQPLGGASQKSLNLGIPPSSGRQSEPKSLDNAWDKAIDIVRPFIGWGAGSLGGAAGGALGALGGPAAPVTVPVGTLAGDVGAYTIVDSLMQQLKTKPPSGSEAMSNSAMEALVNAVAGRTLNGIVKGTMAARSAGMPEIYKLFPTTSQALEHNAIKGLPGIAKALEDVIAPGAKKKAQEISGGAGFFEALEQANMMNGKNRLVNQDPQQLLEAIKNNIKSGITRGADGKQFQTNLHYVSKDFMDAFDAANAGQDQFQVLRNVVNNDAKLQKILSLGQTVGQRHLNVRQDLQAFNLMDMMNRATTIKAPGAPGVARARIDPELLQREWFAPERQSALNKLYGAQQKESLDGLMQRIIQTQDNPLLSSKLAFTGKGIILGGGALPTLLGHGVPSATAAAIYLPTAAFARALTDPKVARGINAMIGAEKVPGMGPESARAILSGLQGVRLALIDKDGKKSWGSPLQESDGSFSWKGEQ